MASSHAHADAQTNGHTNGHHIAPISMYLTIFGALIVGTILTVVVAKFDLGPFNNIVMLTVACAKALLVILYFMHVRWSSRLTWVVAASGFLWLIIMFTMTMQDYMTRGWVPGTNR
jgi:cytochrome c oxidase subunit 4